MGALEGRGEVTMDRRISEWGARGWWTWRWRRGVRIGWGRGALFHAMVMGGSYVGSLVEKDNLCSILTTVK